VPVKGGSHYLHGQPELIAHVADTLVGWLESKGLRA
jgi:hypothetical protein